MSNRVIPRSRASRVAAMAASRSTWPQSPPADQLPKAIRDTRGPRSPSCVYCIDPLSFLGRSTRRPLSRQQDTSLCVFLSSLLLERYLRAILTACTKTRSTASSASGTRNVRTWTSPPLTSLQRITRLQPAPGGDLRPGLRPSWADVGEYLVLAALRRAGPPYRMNPTALYGSVHPVVRRHDQAARPSRASRPRRAPARSSRSARSAGGLTDRGRELVDAAVVDHLANQERLLGALSASERGKLSDLLRKLLASEPVPGA